MLADRQPDYGMSRSARDLALDDCVQLLASVHGLALRTELRKSAITNCAEAADDFIAQSSIDARAWYVLARVAAERKDAAGLNRALLRAHELAPAEQWLAEQRVQLAEEHLADLEPSVLAGHQQDLALLVTSTRGVKAIARRYAAVPSFRERVTAIAETLPAEQQARLVAALRNELASRAPSSAGESSPR